MKITPLTVTDRRIATVYIEAMGGKPVSELDWARWVERHNLRTQFGLEADQDPTRAGADPDLSYWAYEQQTTDRQPLGSVWMYCAGSYYQYGQAESNNDPDAAEFAWNRDLDSTFHEVVCKAMYDIRTMCEMNDDATRTRVESDRYISAVKNLLTESITIKAELLDRNGSLLGCPNGVYDLETYTWHDYDNPPDPKSYITKMTAADYNGEAECPLWLKFLNEACCGDQDLIAFIQRYMGYTLTGDVDAHTLCYLYGPGGNGKGVLTNLWQDILGDYAQNAPPNFLTEKTHTPHDTEIARLKGARLLIADEVAKGARWDEQRLKALTGGDKVTGRFMRQDYIEFKPTFKLFVTGNDLPMLRGVDDAMRRRLRVIPFTFTPKSPNPKLAEELFVERDAILAWAIDGLAEYHEHGLGSAAVIEAETDAYFESEDNMSLWMDAQCVIHSDAKAKAADLYADWSSWCSRNAVAAGTSNTFYRSLSRLGYETKGTGRYKHRAGIGLAAASEHNPTLAAELEDDAMHTTEAVA